MPVNGSSEDQKSFRLSYPLDRDGFFRRECPDCGREFKTQADDADLVSSIAPVFREAGLEVGAEPNVAEENGSKIFLICPYCGHRASPSEMLTRSFSQYLERHILREFIEPQIQRMFSGFSQEISQRSRRASKAIFRLDLLVDYNRSLVGPRPIAGPEPPDMTRVDMLCCGKSIKLLDGWVQLSQCPYCGAQVTLQ